MIWPSLLCVVGVVGAGFGYWGVNTVQGRKIFDEMAGMIPMGVGCVGILMVLVGVVWLWVRTRAS